MTGQSGNCCPPQFGLNVCNALAVVMLSKRSCYVRQADVHGKVRTADTPLRLLAVAIEKGVYKVCMRDHPVWGICYVDLLLR